MDHLSFLDGGGEMGALMRGHDWAATPFGPPETWPQSLKSVLSVCLNSPLLGTVLWGAELRMLYNDACIPLMADRHPGALGRPLGEVWGAAWDQVSAAFHEAMRSGRGFSDHHVELVVTRNGERVATCWNFSAAPIRGEDGSIVGLLNQGTEITEAHRAQPRSDSERARQQQLFDQMPGFVGVLNGPDHVYEYVNEAYEEISGARPLVGLSVRQAFPELVGQGFYGLLDQVFRTGEPYVAYAAPIQLSGESHRRYIDMLYQPIRDEEGAVTGIFVGGYDVTGAHGATAALRESESYVRLLLNSSAEAFYAVQPDGVTTLCNTTFLRMMGFEREEDVLGRKLHDMIHHTHPDGSHYHVGDCPIYICAATGQSAHVTDEFFYRTDGTPLPVEYWARPIIVDGQHRGAICTFIDVTARREAEAARQAVENQLRRLNADLERQVLERSSERGTTWQVSPHLFSVIDLEDARFVRVNPAWTAVLGWSEDELTGASFIDFLHPDEVDASLAAWQDVRRGEAVLNFENRYRARNGSYRWLSWVAVPEAGKLYSNARDITEEKAAREELAATQEALRQAQKMEAVGQLTGGIAHDFNNLLTGITGSLEMLQVRIAQGRLDAVDRYVTAAQGAARRAAALTHRLLAFSRRQTLDPKSTDVNRLVLDMEDLVRRTVGPQIHIEVVGAAGLWPTLVDSNQLENALLNLCINARDAMPDGGRITIETANRWLDDKAALERDLPPGQYISLCVSDTGTGMTPEVIARAFDPFFTTKPLGEGTGLGLSMIYGFVRQSGGQVRIYSELGQGTTMCIYLPRDHAASRGDMSEPARTVGDQHGAGEVVLIVDDEPTIRMLVSEVLEEFGYAGIEAADGPAALQILQTVQKIDLLITDVGLPGGLNGRQLADAARAARPDLKVLFITGYAENAVIGNGHLDHGMQILTKPFAMDTLADKIRAIVEG